MTSRAPRRGSNVERVWRLLVEHGPLLTSEITTRTFDPDGGYTRYSQTYNILVDLEGRGLVRREPTGPQRNAPLRWHARDSAEDHETALAGLDADVVQLEQLLSQCARHLSSLKATVASLRG